MTSPDPLPHLLAKYHAAQQRGDDLSLADLCGGDAELLERLQDALGLRTHSLPADPADQLPLTKQGDSTAASPASRSDSASRAAPEIPGYHIIEELGRGGMGVVYLAHQITLKRPVALKVIRGGHEAGHDQLSRFATEAEAVARLQHPNIVQIFEVGEYHETPYFALEFVEGGNLADRLAAGVLSNQDAASLLETLARAVHHAHMRGIVHRDLKPANVLTGTDGLPKITDFGLAKKLMDSDLTRTRTGVVMGTPNYMSPEQASGQVSRIGPATDIYALGVILYEALTGKVPHAAESVISTLHKVMTEDVEPPSKRRGGIDRDLETICLKCLERVPERRYSSALALAQDLERYLAGEPILARRTSLITKVYRKARKRATTMALVLAAVLALGVAGVVLLQSRSERALAQLERQFDASLAAADWPQGHRDDLEQLIVQMEMLAPERGAEARARLLDRAVERFQTALRQPRLDPQHLAALEADLAWIAARSSNYADSLSGELTNRLRAWQPLFELTAPYANAQDIFHPADIRLDPHGIQFVNETAGSVLPTRFPSHGPVRVEAEFHSSNWKAQSVGLVLQFPSALENPDAFQLPGYMFQLIPVRPPDDSGKAGTDIHNLRPHQLTFEETEGYAAMVIRRNGVVLLQHHLTLTEGPIRIMAERVGEQLTLRVNNEAPISVSDAWPLLQKDGVIAVLTWRNHGPLVSLRAFAQLLPVVSSPLEQADLLYDQARFAEALPLYEQQAASSSGAVRTEALCKAGLCQMELKRTTEAMALFEQCVQAPGTRWPAIGTCHLWLLYLRDKRFEEAQSILATLTNRFTPEQIRELVPVQVRRNLLQQHRQRPMNFLIRDPGIVHELFELEQAARILERPVMLPGYQYQRLIAMMANGNAQQAALECRQFLQAVLETSTQIDQGGVWLVGYAAWLYGWIGPRALNIDEVENSLANLALLTTAQEHHHPYLSERFRRNAIEAYFALARLACQRKDWAKAHEWLDKADAAAIQPYQDYMQFAPGKLIRGFIHDQQGQPDQAREAWRAGVHREFLAQQRNHLIRTPTIMPTARHELIYASMLGSLADEMSDVEAQAMLVSLTGAVADDPGLSAIIPQLNISPAIIRKAWQSPRARELARRIAFLDLDPVEYYRAIPAVLVTTYLSHGLFGGKPTPEQEAALWHATENLAKAFFERQVNKVEMTTLLSAWKGFDGFLGWSGVAKRLSPEIRGSVAYFLGIRMLRLGKTSAARGYFQTCTQELKKEHPTRHLAEAELARLTDSK